MKFLLSENAVLINPLFGPKQEVLNSDIGVYYSDTDIGDYNLDILEFKTLISEF